MNRIIHLLKKNRGAYLLSAFSCVSLVQGFTAAEYLCDENDSYVQLASGDVYVAARQKGRLGCSLSRLPLIKKDQIEAIEEPLMHKIVTLNNEAGKENPLFNDGIRLFSLFESGRGSLPLLVGEHAPAKLYLVECHTPCTVQGDVMVKEKKEEIKPAPQVEKKSKKEDKASEQAKAEEKKEEPAPCAVLSTDILKDAAGNDAGHIVAYEQITPTMIAVVVAPQEGAFGAPGSGVALVQLAEEPDKKDGSKTVRVLKQVSLEGLAGKNSIRAYPLDGASSLVTRNGAQVSFGEHVALHWDKLLERLFVGLDVTSEGNVPVNAVVVGRIEYDEEEQVLVVPHVQQQEKQQAKNKSSKKSKKDDEKEKPQEPKIKRVYHANLLFEPIISPSVVLDQETDYLVAQNGINNDSVIDQLKTVWTGTHIPQLLVVRKDLQEKGNVSIFALPLVSGKSFELNKQRKKISEALGNLSKVTAKEGTPDYVKRTAENEAKKKALENEARALSLSMRATDTMCGILASVEQTVETFFLETHPYGLEESRLAAEAKTAQELYTLTTQAACVGGGALQGTMQALVVKGDTVEVIVSSEKQTNEVFISRPLLNAAGMIERWTVWRPRATVKTVVPEGEAQTRRTYFDGQHVPCAVSVEEKEGISMHKRVKFSDTEEEPVKLFASHVHDVCKNHVMLGACEVLCSQPGSEREALVCAYSTQQLVISSLDRYQKNEASVVQFPCDMKSVRGVAVSAMRSKILFVGGYTGLYALVDASGNGWSLDKKFSDLSAQEREVLSFTRVGGFDKVRSLQCDGQFLYVLTHKTFERIDLGASTFGANGELVYNTLAVGDSLPGHNAMDIFLDCVVSDKLALLATTRGLYRSANNLSVQTVHDFSLCPWVRITVPCQEGPIVQLVPVSVTGLPTDCARYGGGELYVLNSYSGYNSTRVTRYHIEDCSENNVVSDTTIQPLPDRCLKGQETTFIRLNDYTTSLAVAGGTCLLVHPKTEAKPSCLIQKEISSEKAHTGTARFTRTALVLDLAEGESIISVALSTATGKMLVTTTQGLRILD